MKILSWFVVASACIALSGNLFGGARSVEISKTNVENGVISSFELAFGAGEKVNDLYIAYGAVDGGDDISKWERVEKLTQLAPEDTSFVCEVPEGWDENAYCLRFFTGEVNDIPYDCALEYLASSGSEIIDTGVIPTSDTKAEVDMAYLGADTGSNWVGILGERSSSGITSAFTFFVKKDGKKFALNFGNLDSLEQNWSVELGERFKYRNDGNNVYINDELLYSGAEQSFDASHGRSIVVFGFRINSTSFDNRQLQSKLYGLKIWEGDTLLRDYQPCIYDGFPGLWDKVNNTFAPSVSGNLFNASPVAGVKKGEFNDVRMTATVFSGEKPVVSIKKEITADADASALVPYSLSYAGASSATADIYYSIGTNPDAQGEAVLAKSAAAVGEDSFRLSGLNPDTVYYLSVFARSGAGDSAVCGPVAFCTAKAGAAHRTVSIASVEKISGAVSSFNLVFSASPETNILYMAYGAADGGDDIAGWEKVETVAVVDPYTFSLVCPAPNGWGGDWRAVRFFLGAKPDVPYDYDIEYLASSGAQGIDTGRHFMYGQTLSVTWRQNSLFNITNEDKGWGVGTSGPKNITGAGRRNGNYVRPYINSANRDLSPSFSLSKLSTDTVYRDECVIGDTISYTMTDVEGGDTYVVSASISTPDGTAFDSGDNIHLFRCSRDSVAHWGLKAIYRATLSSNDTGAKLFDLVPVMKDGIPCMYDMVTGALHYNVNEDAFPFQTGPRLAMPRVTSTQFVDSTAVYSIESSPWISMTETITNGYTALDVCYSVHSLGSAEKTDIIVKYGYASDSMNSTVSIASGVGVGEGTAQITNLTPGRTYFAQLVPVVDGVEGAPSAIFSFTCAAPDVSPGGYGYRNFDSIEVSGSEATATFSKAICGTVLYAAYGYDFGGDSTNEWDSVVKLGDVSGDATSFTFDLPAGWGSEVKFLRLFFFTGGEEQEVQFLDYVETTGSQYIDTGLYPDKYLTVEETFSTEDASHDKMLFGVRNNGFQYICWLSSLPGTTVVPVYGNKNFSGKSTGKSAGEKMTIRMGPDGILIDGTELWGASSLADCLIDAASTKTLLLFGLRTGSSVEQRKYYGKCYGFKAYQGDELVQHLFPCSVNGTVCMYDAVQGKIFENLGSSALVGGPAIELFDASETIIAQDNTLPQFKSISASGMERGDRLTISGALESAGAGECSIAIETSRSGNFDDVVVWECEGVYGADDSFEVELYSSDVSSPEYIRPGSEVFYRVRVTDRNGSMDISTPASVTMASAFEVGVPTCTGKGRMLTVTAEVLTHGANTNYAWIIYGDSASSLNYSSEKIVIDRDSSSLSVSKSLDVPPGTVYCALVISNDCSTAVWTHSSSVYSVAVKNQVVYTWKSSVKTGAWKNRDNWEADEGQRFDYPTAESTAKFLSGAEVVVEVTDELTEVATLDCSQSGVNVAFTGGVERKLKSGNLNFSGQNNEICVSNINMEISGGGLNIGAGSTYRVCAGSTNNFYGGGNIRIADGVNKRMIIEGKSYVYTFGYLAVGNSGSTVVIDDSRFYSPTTANTGSGVYLCSNASGGEIILKGKNPRLETNSEFRNSTIHDGGKLTFVIPEGGFLEPPIQQVPQSGGTEYSVCKFAESYKGFTVDKITIAVDPTSPGLRAGDVGKTPLISWNAGIDLTHIVFDASATNGVNTILYSAEFDAPYSWSDSWNDANGVPLSMGFSCSSAGLLLLIR